MPVDSDECVDSGYDPVHDLADAIARVLVHCDETATEVRRGAHAGPNLPELLSWALEVVASEQRPIPAAARSGGRDDPRIEALVRHRPNCPEAELVRRLVRLTT